MRRGDRVNIFWVLLLLHLIRSLIEHLLVMRLGISIVYSRDRLLISSPSRRCDVVAVTKHFRFCIESLLRKVSSWSGILCADLWRNQCSSNDLLGIRSHCIINLYARFELVSIVFLTLSLRSEYHVLRVI